uniref:Uncharacterized protein n=1 Tax=viral metagenome TaxID=1070528 RepID=A0A6C0H997_9ZZZZ
MEYIGYQNNQQKYKKKYIKYKNKYINLISGGTMDISLNELQEYKLNEEYTYTQEDPIAYYCKHPSLENVFCIFEKVVSHDRYNTTDGDYRTRLNLIKDNTFKPERYKKAYKKRWVNFCFILRGDGIQISINKFFDFYMVYMVLLNDSIPTLDAWFNTFDIESRNLIIQMTANIDTDTGRGVHYYISNNTDGELRGIWGKSIPFDPIYKRQSIILHSFSAYVISNKFNTIQYIWTSPSDAMTYIFNLLFSYIQSNSLVLGEIKLDDNNPPEEYNKRPIKKDQLNYPVGGTMYIQIKFLADIFKNLLYNDLEHKFYNTIREL